MSNALFLKDAMARAGRPQDRWTGKNQKQFFKTGPNPSLTHWGRVAILKEWDSGIKSPIRIAVRLGIPNRIVQMVLAGLRGRDPDFTNHEYYSHTPARGGFTDG